MKRFTAKAFRVFALLLFSSTFWTTFSYGVTHEQIFVWISRQMDIEYLYDMPEVHYVSKNELQRVFQDYSKKSFQRWRVEHGQAGADRIMASYQNRLVGLFNPKTHIIYVGDFLMPCRQKAVLAHEMTHYLQDWMYGPIDARSFSAEDQRLFREIEAYQMEAKFKELFCEPTVHSDLILAFMYYP